MPERDEDEDRIGTPAPEGEVSPNDTADPQVDNDGAMPESEGETEA